jgi:hypothetical protein
MTIIRPSGKKKKKKGRYSNLREWELGWGSGNISEPSAGYELVSLALRIRVDYKKELSHEINVGYGRYTYLRQRKCVVRSIGATLIKLGG